MSLPPAAPPPQLLSPALLPSSATSACATLRDGVRSVRSARSCVESLRTLCAFDRDACLLPTLAAACTVFKSSGGESEENKLLRGVYEYVYAAAASGVLQPAQRSALLSSLLQLDLLDSNSAPRRNACGALAAFVLRCSDGGDDRHASTTLRHLTTTASACITTLTRGSSSTSTGVMAMLSRPSRGERDVAAATVTLPSTLTALAVLLTPHGGDHHSRLELPAKSVNEAFQSLSWAASATRHANLNRIAGACLLTILSRPTPCAHGSSCVCAHVTSAAAAVSRAVVANLNYERGSSAIVFKLAALVQQPQLRTPSLLDLNCHTFLNPPVPEPQRHDADLTGAEALSHADLASNAMTVATRPDAPVSVQVAACETIARLEPLHPVALVTATTCLLALLRRANVGRVATTAAVRVLALNAACLTLALRFKSHAHDGTRIASCLHAIITSGVRALSGSGCSRAGDRQIKSNWMTALAWALPTAMPSNASHAALTCLRTQRESVHDVVCAQLTRRAQVVGGALALAAWRCALTHTRSRGAGAHTPRLALRHASTSMNVSLAARVERWVLALDGGADAGVAARDVAAATRALQRALRAASDASVLPSSNSSKTRPRVWGVLSSRVDAATAAQRVDLGHDAHSHAAPVRAWTPRVLRQVHVRTRVHVPSVHTLRGAVAIAATRSPAADVEDGQLAADRARVLSAMMLLHQGGGQGITMPLALFR